MLALQILFAILYGIFVKAKVHTDQTLNPTKYPLFQDINVMMLIGFGFLMTFIKSYSWSALAYTFFTNAIVIEFYLLISPFWHRVFDSEASFSDPI